jgi:SNF2 family DNA or RNA helicase
MSKELLKNKMEQIQAALYALEMKKNKDILNIHGIKERMCDSKYKEWCDLKGLDTKPHQVEGKNWCLENEFTKGGGILADEMGLGKTIIMLSLLSLNPENNNLIVVPKALLKQWKFVLEKLNNPNDEILVFHGSQVRAHNSETIVEYGVVLTTYGMISTRKDVAYKSVLWDIDWGRVIYDEAHNMKDMKSNVFTGALKIKSKFKWMVTGTPIQNRLGDIYSLATLLGERIRGNEHLKEFIENRLLRRTKEGLGIKMPDIEFENVDVKFDSEEEETMSKAIHSRCGFTSVTLHNVNKAINLMEGPNPLVMYIRSRQMCVYPKLIVDNLEKIKENDEMLEDCSFNEIQTKSKIDAIVKKIKNEKKEEKKIIFCHYRKEIDCFKEVLEQNGFSVCVLDGRTKRGEFSKICESLDYDVLLGQIKTASEGLNLQQYSQVYFTSPHWNPAMEDQCIARCHRIGQKKNVKVFKFVMKWTNQQENRDMTLDEYANVVQERKREYMNLIEK